MSHLNGARSLRYRMNDSSQMVARCDVPVATRGAYRRYDESSESWPLSRCSATTTAGGVSSSFGLNSDENNTALQQERRYHASSELRATARLTASLESLNCARHNIATAPYQFDQLDDERPTPQAYNKYNRGSYSSKINYSPPRGLTTSPAQRVVSDQAQADQRSDDHVNLNHSHSSLGRQYERPSTSSVVLADVLRQETYLPAAAAADLHHRDQEQEQEQQSKYFSTSRNATTESGSGQQQLDNGHHHWHNEQAPPPPRPTRTQMTGHMTSDVVIVPRRTSSSFSPLLDPPLHIVCRPRRPEEDENGFDSSFSLSAVAGNDGISAAEAAEAEVSPTRPLRDMDQAYQQQHSDHNNNNCLPMLSPSPGRSSHAQPWDASTDAAADLSACAQGCACLECQVEHHQPLDCTTGDVASSLSNPNHAAQEERLLAFGLTASGQPRCCSSMSIPVDFATCTSDGHFSSLAQQQHRPLQVRAQTDSATYGRGGQRPLASDFHDYQPDHHHQPHDQYNQQAHHQHRLFSTASADHADAHNLSSQFMIGQKQQQQQPQSQSQASPGRIVSGLSDNQHHHYQQPAASFQQLPLLHQPHYQRLGHQVAAMSLPSSPILLSTTIHATPYNYNSPTFQQQQQQLQHSRASQAGHGPVIREMLPEFDSYWSQGELTMPPPPLRHLHQSSRANSTISQVTPLPRANLSQPNFSLGGTSQPPLHNGTAPLSSNDSRGHVDTLKNHFQSVQSVSGGGNAPAASHQPLELTCGFSSVDNSENSQEFGRLLGSMSLRYDDDNNNDNVPLDNYEQQQQPRVTAQVEEEDENEEEENDYNGEEEEDDEDDEDDDGEGPTSVVLVPSQARGRLPISVAKQMSEQASKFVQRHGSSFESSRRHHHQARVQSAASGSSSSRDGSSVASGSRRHHHHYEQHDPCVSDHTHHHHHRKHEHHNHSQHRHHHVNQLRPNSSSVPPSPAAAAATANNSNTLATGSSSGSGLKRNKSNNNLQVRRTLRIKIRKSKPILGIAIEGGFNVSGQLLPRIVCVHEEGAAYQCGKLRASDLILEVNGISTVNMTHNEIAKTIANAYYQDERPYIEFLIGESVHV